MLFKDSASPEKPAEPVQLSGVTPSQEHPAQSRTSSRLQRLKRIEQLEAASYDTLTYTGNARWMIPYADLMTLLLGFFVVMASMAFSNPSSSSATQMAKPTDPNNPNASALTAEAAASETLAQNPEDAQRLESLKEKLKATDILINQESRGIVMSLKDSILFPVGNATLTPQAKQTLHQLAAALKSLPGESAPLIRVEGHTDNSPIHTAQFPSNWELSTARAVNILKYLVETQGFDPKTVSAGGYGEYQPLAPNSSNEGKQKNRRVDIVLLSEVSRQSADTPAAAPPKAVATAGADASLQPLQPSQSSQPSVDSKDTNNLKIDL